MSDSPPESSRLRILRVIARMNVGGPAMQASVLTSGLNRDRFDQRLLIGDVGSDEADFLELRAGSMSFGRVAGLGRTLQPFDDARALKAIAAEVRRFRPHIVHTHTAKAGVLGRVAALMGRVPARVHTFHGHLLHGYFSSAKTRAIIHAERALARFTTRIVAVGERVRDELLTAGIGHSQQYTVIAPGVELRPLPERQEARTLLGVQPDALVVAYLGRLIPVKRPDRFVDMASALSKSIPHARFLVCGDGSLAEETRERALPLDGRIRFLGWRGDVETIYAACDVVVVSSDNEGMPVSLIEAALAARPTVTTAVGSAPEVVLDGVTGFVTECEPQALVERTKRLLGDTALRERMGRMAKERAEREFSGARLIEDTESLYEEVAAELP